MQKSFEEFFGPILWLAFLSGLVLCGYYAYQVTPRELYDMRKWDATTYEHSAKVCNSAPYDIKAVIAYPVHEKQIGLELVPELDVKTFFREVKAGHFEPFFKDVFKRAVLSHTQDYSKLQISPEQSLKPGECQTIKATFRRGRERFFIHSQPVDIDDAVGINQEVKRFIQNNQSIQNSEEQPLNLKASSQLNWPDDNSTALFTDGIADIQLSTIGIPQCELYDISHKAWSPAVKVSAGIDLSSGKQRVGFGCMKANSLSEFIAVFEAPGISLVAVNENNQIANLEAALQNAANLARLVIERRENLALAQKKQREFLATYKEPYEILFGTLDDPNGSTEEGIFLRDMPEHDIFDEPRTLPVGVWIQKINQQPVFGVADFMHELNRHALTYTEGIEKPVVITYYDGEYYRDTTARFFFNPEAFKESYSGTAIWHGLMDAVTFGNSGEADCVATNALTGLVNVISEVAGDKSKLEYVDMQKCIWRENTNKAIARQFNSDLYKDSSFLAIFLPTPSLFRSIAGKPVQRGVTRALGRGKFAGAVTNAIIETAEAVAYDIGTAPPGTPFGIRLKQVIQAGTPQVAASTAGVMHFVLGNRRKAIR